MYKTQNVYKEKSEIVVDDRMILLFSRTTYFKSMENLYFPLELHKNLL